MISLLNRGEDPADQHGAQLCAAAQQLAVFRFAVPHSRGPPHACCCPAASTPCQDIVLYQNREKRLGQRFWELPVEVSGVRNTSENVLRIFCCRGITCEVLILLRFLHYLLLALVSPSGSCRLLRPGATCTQASSLAPSFAAANRLFQAILCFLQNVLLLLLMLLLKLLAITLRNVPVVAIRPVMQSLSLAPPLPMSFRNYCNSRNLL
jgi:hypothetical protein